MQKPPLIAKVDLMAGCGCELSGRALSLVEAGYVGSDQKTPPRIISAAISCAQTYPALITSIRKRYKGNLIREANRCRGKTTRREFVPSEWADDIERINKSLDVRSGGAMRPAYQRSADELRIAYEREPRCDCINHWSVWWGVFSTPNVSGDRIQLLGYINLKRIGGLVLYSTIMGHGDHLGKGIMPSLHLQVSEDILCGDGRREGIKWLMYAGYNDGKGHGLRLWKKKAGFNPVMFVHQ